MTPSSHNASNRKEKHNSSNAICNKRFFVKHDKTFELRIVGELLLYFHLQVLFFCPTTLAITSHCSSNVIHRSAFSDETKDNARVSKLVENQRGVQAITRRIQSYLCIFHRFLIFRSAYEHYPSLHLLVQLQQ